MVSVNDDFPSLISEDGDNPSQPFDPDERAVPRKSPKPAASPANSEGLDDESGNATSYPHLAGDESSDPGRSTPNGKRNAYCYKKLKPMIASPAAGGSDEYRVDYRKDREEWSDSAITCLLDAYTEKFNQLNRGNLRGRDWEEVAEIVSERCNKQKSYKSVEQCKNKIDNLKKRYKVELQRMNTGGICVSHWHWFKKIEAIVGNSPTFKHVHDDDGSVGTSFYSLRQPKRCASGIPVTVNNVKAKPVPNTKWRRVVFKISGAALSGDCRNIDPKAVMQVAREVAMASRSGVEVAIVVGGRNFFCGESWISSTGLDTSAAYQTGLMATVMNSVLFQSALEKLGVQTRMQSGFCMPDITESYSRQRAIRHLEKGRVVIFGGIGAGTGSPLFSTDTAAALRAAEVNAEALLKGTNMSGFYECGSPSNPRPADHVSFREMMSRGLTAMDVMAMTYCEENGIPVVLFNLLEPGNISRALCGDPVGTLIDQCGRVV